MAKTLGSFGMRSRRVNRMPLVQMIKTSVLITEQKTVITPMKSMNLPKVLRLKVMEIKKWLQVF